MMDTRIVDEVTCPICIETLKSPIRILSCEHNFCEDCLIALLRSPTCDERCPVCRHAISVQANAVKSLPRNRVVENMIAELLLNTSEEQHSSNLMNRGQKMNSSEIKKTKELVKTFLKKENFNEAIKKLLRLIKNDAVGCNQIPAMVDIAKCLLKTGQTAQAHRECEAMAAKINLEKLDSVGRSFLINCDNNIRELIGLCTEMCNYKSALILARSSLEVVDRCFEGKTKLSKLEEIVHLIQCAAGMTTLHSQEFKSHIEFMEAVVDKMSEIENVDCKDKCLKVSSVLEKIGDFYISTKQYSQCFEKNLQVTSRLMKIVFGKKSSEYGVFKSCSYNMTLARANKLML